MVAVSAIASALAMAPFPIVRKKTSVWCVEPTEAIADKRKLNWKVMKFGSWNQSYRRGIEPRSPQAKRFTTGSTIFTPKPIHNTASLQLRSWHSRKRTKKWRETDGFGNLLKPLIRLSCSEVIGCSHMYVFIAGATKKGREKSQARAIHVYHSNRSTFENFQRTFSGVDVIANATQHSWVHYCTNRLSQRPLESFARVLADRGAMSKISAHLLNYDRAKFMSSTSTWIEATIISHLYMLHGISFRVPISPLICVYVQK